MTHEEAYPEAAAVLRDAGWKPHDGWGVYTRDTLVMGFQPDGQAFHAKNWAAITEGHPQWGPDTPDTPEEAALWLVERFKPNPLTTEATLEPLAPQSEEVENPRTYDEATAEYLAEHPEDQPNERGDERGDLDIDGGIQAQETRGTDPIDADFTIEDLGGPDEQDLLEPPPPEDFAPEDFAPEPEAPQDRFIGLDDLDRVRSLRIGDVATEALRLTTLIEQAVSEQEGEFSNIQAYVVSNLDKHTGAFTPQDEASRATYGRFLELSSARSKIALIDARRKDATAFLIAAGRDEVVNFDVQAAFA